MIWLLSFCKAVIDSFINNENLSVNDIIRKRFGSRYNESDMYFIVIQGSTSSGKSSFASSISKSLKNLNPFVIHLDDFYNFQYGAAKDESNVDFDHPSMLNWTNIYSVINSLINRDKMIPVFNRDSTGCQYVDNKGVNNKGYNVVIIEGLYAFNCLNDRIFNLESRSLTYIKNDKILKNIGMHVFNIQLYQCKNKMYSLRIDRDKCIRNVEEKVVRDRLDRFIYPATLNWVYSDKFSYDLRICHGNFNREVVKNVINSLSKFFECEYKFMPGFLTDLTASFYVKCGEDCKEPIY